MNFTSQDANHAAQTFLLSAGTIIADNFFEIITAIGLVINLVIVVKTYADKKRLSAEERIRAEDDHRMAIERHEYEMEIRRRQLNELSE